MIHQKCILDTEILKKYQNYLNKKKHLISLLFAESQVMRVANNGFLHRLSLVD